MDYVRLLRFHPLLSIFSLDLSLLYRPILTLEIMLLQMYAWVGKRENIALSCRSFFKASKLLGGATTFYLRHCVNRTALAHSALVSQLENSSICFDFHSFVIFINILLFLGSRGWHTKVNYFSLFFAFFSSSVNLDKFELSTPWLALNRTWL